MNTTKYWHPPHLQQVELLQAAYTTQHFPLHMHEEFAMGVIQQGHLGFHYRGQHLVASKGDINLCNAGEYHTGKAQTDQGWSYRMFYLPPTLLADLHAQATDRSPQIPFFGPGVIRDHSMADQLLHLHTLVTTDSVSDLTQQHLLLTTLLQFISRHAENPPLLHRIGQESYRINRIREYIEAYHQRNIQLNELSELIGLSPFHLTRVFQRQVGVPPHAYLNQVRVRHAKANLSQGVSIAQVALDTGFVDQSHLNKHFKQIFGITPGQYKSSIARTYKTGAD